jgi:hypothetical protein
VGSHNAAGGRGRRVGRQVQPREPGLRAARVWRCRGMAPSAGKSRWSVTGERWPVNGGKAEAPRGGGVAALSGDGKEKMRGSRGDDASGLARIHSSVYLLEAMRREDVRFRSLVSAV